MLRTKPDTGTAHTPDHSETARALAEAKANEIYSSQLMRRFRDTLSNVRDGLEDEGDRIYFGSTNDADQLRDIIEEIEELEWDRILASSQKKPDLYARIRELNTEVRALRAARDGMLEALVACEKQAEEARLILINHLNEPERTAFWKAVNIREFARAALARAEGRS